MHKNRKILLIIFGIIILVVCLKLLFGVFKFSPVLFELLFKPEVELKKTSDNTINILLLGIGGGAHEGPNLTDTIIFTSINPKTNKIIMVSIPRDLWVPDLQAKVNTAYAFGEEQGKGKGLVLAKAAIAKILGQPIDYAIRIDFSGFEKAIDLIGGIDILVERTFDDYEYPVAGKEDDPCGHAPEEINILATGSSQLEAFPCRYKHIHFNKGMTHMNGQTALEYVRSRHALGAEGSDFARSRRQEKVISAFKDKVLSLDTFLNPGRVLSLYSLLEKSIDTDIKQDEFDDFIKLAQKMKNAKLQNTIVDYGDSTEGREGLLTIPVDSSDYNGQWVLIPRVGNGDFSEVKEYVACEIKSGKCPVLSPTIGK